MDYKVKYETYDSEKGEAVLAIVGNDEYAGGYKGSSRFRVRWAPKYDIGKAKP